VRKVDPVRHEERRIEILVAAKRCFARRGFHGATIAEICDEAGISPGHLYHYFPGKEAIIAAITRTGLDYTAARFAEIDGRAREAGGAAPDPLDTLAEEYALILALGRDTRSSVHLDVLAEAARDPAIGKVLQDTSREMRDLIADFLRAGQARGRIDPALDVDTAAALLISLIDACKTLQVRDPEIDPERSAATLGLMVRRFLAAG
jgi:TetR/AcrR family transcriptional repressor of uid operon